MLEDLDKIKKDLEEYINLQLDSIKLHSAESVSKILTKTAKLVVIGYLLLFILLFASVATGFYIASIFGSDALGFLIITLFYLLLLVVFIMFRKKIVDRPIIKGILKIFFPE
jgi:hypothetical protein